MKIFIALFLAVLCTLETGVTRAKPAPQTRERVYFDTQTYLPVRMNAVAMLGTMAVPVEIYLDDWREVDGVKYPFSISQNFSKLTLIFTVSEIKHNVPIDARIFEP
jgi:hypothetical protein